MFETGAQNKNAEHGKKRKQIERETHIRNQGFERRGEHQGKSDERLKNNSHVRHIIFIGLRKKLQAFNVFSHALHHARPR